MYISFMWCYIFKLCQSFYIQQWMYECIYASLSAKLCQLFCLGHEGGSISKCDNDQKG